MPKIAYLSKRFHSGSLDVIAKANQLIEAYLADGLTLTLRQLYYRFVASGWIENSQRSYDRLGSIINNARLAGLVDWDAIEDRGRNLLSWPSESSPQAALLKTARRYRRDLWQGQPQRAEVWVEKQALESVVGRGCSKYRVPHMACKGYLSQSEAWRASQRFERYADEGVEKVTVIHLGDHDPSGLDMTRDNSDRLLYTFGLEGYVGEVEVFRIALNMDQVEEFNPPPNPAKLTDTRAKDYIREHGKSSWELDALEPSYLVSLIEDSVEPLIDSQLWEEALTQEQQERETIKGMAQSLS